MRCFSLAGAGAAVCLCGVKTRKTPPNGSRDSADAPHSWVWAIGWLGLLVLPGLAAGRLSLRHDVGWVVLGVGAVSGIVFLLYAVDKRRAQRAGAERLPEAGLHALELLGGWPGAFAAQRLLRHKNAKLSYQAVFWLIVALWQFVALDLLLGWRMTRALVG